MIGATYTFRSAVSIVGRIPIYPEAAIRDTLALRACSVPFAMKHGGPIIGDFIAALPEDWRNDPLTVIRAMPAWLRAGWSEGHVGWHLDGVGSRADGQEAWVDGRSPEFRRIGCNMGPVAPTRVLAGDFTLPAYPLGQPLTSLWCEHLDEALLAGHAQEIIIEQGELFMLTSSSFHSISAAARDGWRMFFDANRPCDGCPSLLAAEDFYREIESDFQPTNSREQALMAAYHPVDGR